MKGKSGVSFIAVVLILGAIVILLKNVIPEIRYMKEGELMLVLMVLGVLVGIIALIVKGNSSKDKEEGEGEPSDELKLKHTELKLQELHKIGILTNEEYQKKLTEARIKMGGYKKTIDNLKALLDAGILTQEEYKLKSNEAYEKSNPKPLTNEPNTNNDPADKVARLIELREAELITQEEFEEQMSKI